MGSRISGPHDPFEHPFRVEPIEKDRLTKGESPLENVPKPSPLLGAIIRFIITTLQQFLNRLKASDTEIQKMANHLLLFKDFFEILKEEDRSQDTHFLKELSRSWRLLLEDVHGCKNDGIVKRYLVLIDQIQFYPNHEKRPVGYYLTSKSEWIALPYMEFIYQMYKEHQRNPSQSTLSIWTLDIDHFIQLLKSSASFE